MASKDVAQTVRRARKGGWDVTPTANGHLRFEHPLTGAIVHAGSTPSDHRATANTTARLKRAGLDLHASDPQRQKRREEAKAAAERARLTASVLESLQTSVGALTVEALAESTGSSDEAVQAVLASLLSVHPELGCEAGRFFWDPPLTEFELWKVRQAERHCGSTVFERVDVAPNGSLVLRDESGKLWLAAPLDGVTEVDLRHR